VEWRVNRLWPGSNDRLPRPPVLWRDLDRVG